MQNTEQLAGTVKFENQAILQALQFRQNTVQILKDLQILYEGGLIASMEMQGKLSEKTTVFIQCMKDKIIAAEIEIQQKMQQ